VTAAPLEFYVGNTTPRATAEIIGSVLTKCAKGVEPTTSFKVLEVVQLATHLENPRTKSWKVLVPYKFKQLMEQETMYPSGWVHRKFFGARKAKDNTSKQPRLDDKLVQEYHEEQEKKRVELQKQAEAEQLQDVERLAAEQLERELQDSTVQDSDAMSDKLNLD
jgi:hypothetical protein